MRILFTSGTTGTPKICVYTVEKIDRLLRQLQKMMDVIGYHPEKAIKYAYNFFPSKRPNLAHLQVAQFEHIDNIAVVDCGNAIDEVPQMWCCYPPSLIAGAPQTLVQILKSDMAKERLTHIVSGGFAPTQELVDTVAHYAPNAKLYSVYAQSEMGICFITDDNHAEGYRIDMYDDVKVHIHPERKEIMVNHTGTGDRGFINQFGKLDLEITRIDTEPQKKNCEEAND